MTKNATRMAGGMLAGLALLLAGGAEAKAGTYTVHQCSYPGASPEALFAGWGNTRSNDSAGYRTSNCGVPNGSLTFHLGTPSGTMPGSGYLLGDAEIPADRPGVEIDNVKVSYSARGTSSPYHATVVGGAASGPASYSQNVVTGLSNQSADFSLPGGERGFYFGVVCAFGSPGCAFGSFENTLTLHGLELRLSESVTPTAPAVDGGSLLSSGSRSGTETLDYRVTDADSGVAKVDIKLGPTRVGGDDFTGQPARCPFADWNACARDTGQQSVAVDTRAVPDGTHNLTVTTTDAAGNQRSVSGGQVSVRNAPPSAGGGAPGGGGPGTSGGTGTPNGIGGGPGTKVLAHDKRSRRKVRTRSTQPARISGRLLNRHDQPVAEARVTVLEQSVGSSAVKEVGQVRTDSAGRFSYAAPAGRTRKLLFGYRAQLEDEQFTSITHVRIESVAVVRLKPSSVRTRPGMPLALRGQVIGRPFPRRGVLVALQGRARGSKKWLTFATTRTDSRGRFKSGYRFRSFGRFQLRAVAKADSGWHYTPGTSPPRRVVVR